MSIDLVTCRHATQVARYILGFWYDVCDNPMAHYTYILKCADGTLYVGSTNNLEKRLAEHNGSKSGAHYTKIRRPVEVVYAEESAELGESRRREAEIKTWSREKKLAFLATIDPTL